MAYWDNSYSKMKGMKGWAARVLLILMIVVVFPLSCQDTAEDAEMVVITAASTSYDGVSTHIWTTEGHHLKLTGRYLVSIGRTYKVWLHYGTPVSIRELE